MSNGISQLGEQPIFTLPEGTLRSKGKDARRNSISAAKAVGDTVRTTLGPKGMDKILVDSLGDIVITNDGATILDQMQIEHPAAKTLVEVAKTQDEEVGDGTTSAVVISGELLKNAESLLEQGIHPTLIAKGFGTAKENAVDVLQKVGIDVKFDDDKTLIQIAETVMTGKSAENASGELAEVAVKAVKNVTDMKNGNIMIDTNNIKIEKKQEGSISDTVMIEGVLIDKDIVHSSMPNRLENAKIALVNDEFEVKKTNTDSKIDIDSPEKMHAFLDTEDKTLKDMVQKVIDSGANVLLCQKGIDDLPQHYLSKAGILAVRRLKESDMKLLVKSTGAKIVNNIKDLGKDSLGYAGLVYERKIAGDEMIFVEKCKKPKAVTILVRGGTEHVVDEIERGMQDAVRGVAAALELGSFVPGGGASEMEVSKSVRIFAESFSGKEQLAINAFANAVESIPRSLAENAGMDPIDKLAAMRSEHDKGLTATGLDVFSGETKNMLSAGVIEPLKTKLHVIKSAADAAEMILRIDDMITAGNNEKKGSPMPPTGGMENY